MLAHPDDFMPFLPSITGEDSAGATEHDGLITESEFKKYCSNVAETGEWGGEPEVRCHAKHTFKADVQIQALSRAFSVPIHVIQSGPPTIVSHGGADDAFGGGLTPEQSAALGDRIVRISYHKRMYGLGEVNLPGDVGVFVADSSTTTPCAKLARRHRASLRIYGQQNGPDMLLWICRSWNKETSKKRIGQGEGKES